MRLRLPRRRIWRAAIYLICLLLVLTAADLVLVQVRRTIHPGYDTTRIVSPTLPDGRVDYLKYIDDRRSEGVTPSNNAAVLFLQALGRVALPRTQPPDGITDRLGMPHLPEQGDYLTDLNAYCTRHFLPVPPDPPDGDIPATWPVHIEPLRQQWIESNAHPLDLLTQASARTRYFIPFDGGNRPEMLIEVLLPHAVAFRNVGTTLLTRAVIRLQSGDCDGCIRDLLAAHRLARLLSQCATLIERINAQKHLEVPALQVDRLAAASGKLSVEQIKSLAAQLHALGDLPPLGEYVDDERFMILDTCQALASMPPDRVADVFNGAFSSHPIFEKPVFRFLPVPYESDMRDLNHVYDGALAALREEDYPRRHAALQLWKEQVSRSKNSNPVSIAWSSDFFIAQLIFAIAQVQQHQEQAMEERRLTEISLCLAAYKADHGQYPAALNDLTPAYLAAVPADLFTGNPPIYHPAAAGYALYSVGPDMIDNGGHGDDIQVNMP